MNLHAWAQRHGVSSEALAELRADLGLTRATAGDASESAVQDQIRLEAARRGVQLYRNNCGSLPDVRGVPVRFGLANDTPAMSKRFKSSDLIGIDSRPITLDEVGRPRGRFVSIEVKEAGWHYRGTPREVAQLAWIENINARGGMARFVNTHEGIFG